MNAPAYVISTSRKERREWLAFRKGKPNNFPVPEHLCGAAMDVAILEKAGLQALASVSARIIPESTE